MFYSMSRNTGHGNGAGEKAPKDINEILRLSGWDCRELYTSKGKLHIRVQSVMTIMKLIRQSERDDIVLIQWPLYLSKVINPDILFRLESRHKIILIHDIESLRYGRYEKGDLKKDINFFNKFDVLIVHNRFMREWLYNNGVNKPMIELELFDYLPDDNTVECSEKKVFPKPFDVCFAGNLEKSRFIEKLDLNMETHIGLYGYQPSYQIKNKNIQWKGFYPANKLNKVLAEDFGLLWDGDSCDTCSGNMGNYMKYNNPHKLSLYIAANKPVLVWKYAAVAEFVEKNRIGFALESLLEIDDLLKKLDPEQYQQIQKNVNKVSRNVCTGFYTRKALQEAVRIVCK